MKISINYHRPLPKWQDPDALDQAFSVIRGVVKTIMGAESFIEAIIIGFTELDSNPGHINVKIVVCGPGITRREFHPDGFMNHDSMRESILRHLRGLKDGYQEELIAHQSSFIAFERAIR